MSDLSKSTENNKDGSLDSSILVSIIRFNDQILAEQSKLLSIWGMTVLQYNALHVIYENDAQKIGLSSREIGEGLNTRVPDITRLLDRMVDKKWVIRERDAENRRVVRTRLTSIGIELVESASPSFKELQMKLLESMANQEKTELSGLLDKVLSKLG